jgi:hypothetical protein
MPSVTSRCCRCPSKTSAACASAESGHSVNPWSEAVAREDLSKTFFGEGREKADPERNLARTQAPIDSLLLRQIVLFGTLYGTGGEETTTGRGIMTTTHLSLCVLVFVVLLSGAESWSFAARALRRVAATACLVVVGCGVDEAAHAEAEQGRPVLTARELLSSDIAYRVQELEGDLFVLKLSDSIIDTQPTRYFDIIRSQLRTEPVKGLRLTLKALRKYLPSADAQKAFDIKREELIESISDVDNLLLRRSQGELTKGDEGDTELRALLQRLYLSLSTLISLVKEEPQ